MKQDLLKGLTEEQIKKAKSCNNTDELLALAKAEGVELTEEQLGAVSGGECSSFLIVCPWCGAWASVLVLRNGNRYCESCDCLFSKGGGIINEGRRDKRK